MKVQIPVKPILKLKMSDVYCKIQFHGFFQDCAWGKERFMWKNITFLECGLKIPNFESEYEEKLYLKMAGLSFEEAFPNKTFMEFWKILTPRNKLADINWLFARYILRQRQCIEDIWRLREDCLSLCELNQ